MVSTLDYKALQDASARFLAESNFSHPQVENTMVLVFGEYNVHDRYAEGTEANEWRLYFSGLAEYEEGIQGGGMIGLMPSVRGYYLHSTTPTNLS